MTNQFPRARFAGLVSSVAGTSLTLTLPHAAQQEAPYVGDPNPRGTVGEFLVIDAQGVRLLARLVRVELSPRDMHRGDWGPGAVPPDTPLGQAQLLATVQPNGSLTAGAEVMPRIGDSVFTASSAVLAAGIGSMGAGLRLGHLSHYPSVGVSLDPEDLLGRHLAVIGSTGGGKSWTVAHIAEEIIRAGGRLLILDATGEYSTLTSRTTHLVLGEGRGTGEDVVMALHEMSDQDRTLFFRPSSGSQLPKMAAAITSLRLAYALGLSHPIVSSSGHVIKRFSPRADYQQAERANVAVANNPHSPFDVRKLAHQIGYECIYPTDRNRDHLFGDTNQQEVGWCSPLMTRVEEICRSDAIMRIVSPKVGQPSVLEQIMSWMKAGTSGVMRVDLSRLPQANYLREIVVNTIGNRLLESAREGALRANPLVIAIDEAHQFLGRTLGDDLANARPEAFELIAKEGRKFGLALIVATQRPGDLPAGVLSQMGCMVVHRLTERRDQDHVADASSHLDRDVARMLPALVPGECILVGSTLPLAVPVRLLAPSSPPNSEGPRFAAWNSVQLP